MSGLYSILSRHCNHPSGSKVLTVGVELTWGTSIPAATKKEHNRRTLVGQLVVLGGENIELEFNVTKLFAAQGLVDQGSVRHKSPAQAASVSINTAIIISFKSVFLLMLNAKMSSNCVAIALAKPEVRRSAMGSWIHYKRRLLHPARRLDDCGGSALIEGRSIVATTCPV